MVPISPSPNPQPATSYLGYLAQVTLTLPQFLICKMVAMSALQGIVLMGWQKVSYVRIK